jgi:hypothetical protein
MKFKYTTFNIPFCLHCTYFCRANVQWNKVYFLKAMAILRVFFTSPQTVFITLVGGKLKMVSPVYALL